MKHRPSHSVPYSTGRLVVQSPCSVGQEAFTAVEDGHQYCHQCQRRVHDMTRMDVEEIKALFAAHRGNVCGSIRYRPEAIIETAVPPPSPIRKPIYWKHMAVAASIFLLHQAPYAKSPSKPAAMSQVEGNPGAHGSKAATETEPDWKTNTLLTGVVLNQDDQLVPLDIPILIYADGELITKVTSSHGLFQCQLAGKAKPDAIITVMIREPKDLSKQAQWRGSNHGPGKVTTRLRDAQNLNIKIQYHFPTVRGRMGWEDTPSLDQRSHTDPPSTSPTLDA